MSTPSNGSWNDEGQNSGPQSQYGAGQGAPQGFGQQSLGQGYGQGGFGQPEQGGYQGDQGQGGYGQGDQAGFGQQGQGDRAGFGQQGQGAFGQPDHGGYQNDQGGFGQPDQGGVGAPVKAGGGGLGDLFSDFAFRKSLTEKIASIAFLITVVWVVLDLVRVLANAWGSQGNGEFEVKNMGGFEAFMTTLSALAWAVFVIVVARVLLELAVNVARLARNRD